MVLNILISLGIAIGYLVILYFVAIILILVTKKIDDYIKNKKEEVGLEKWYRIDTIIRGTLMMVGMVSLLTYFVYILIFT